MRRTRISIVMFAAIAMLITLAATPSALARSPLLFTTTSSDLRITGTKGHMRISLPSAAPLSWFTDRPTRRSGVASAAFLVAGWTPNGFARNAPNAALITTRGRTTMQTIVTLRDPQQARGRTSFAYTVLDSHEMLGMRTTGRPGLGHYVGQLFVDDGSMPPCPSTRASLAYAVDLNATYSQTCVASAPSWITASLYTIGTATVAFCGPSDTVGIASGLDIGSVLFPGQPSSQVRDVPSCADSPQGVVLGTLQADRICFDCTVPPQIKFTAPQGALVIITYTSPSGLPNLPNVPLPPGLGDVTAPPGFPTLPH